MHMFCYKAEIMKKSYLYLRFLGISKGHLVIQEYVRQREYDIRTLATRIQRGAVSAFRVPTPNLTPYDVINKMWEPILLGSQTG